LKTIKNDLPVTAVMVHFRTYDLTRMAVWSLQSYYPELRLLIIENNSRDGSREQLKDLQAYLPGMEIVELNEHLHHGPGMDTGIRTSSTEWVLVCDTDCIVYRPGAIEAMLGRVTQDTYMIGEIQDVDTGGFPAQKASKDTFQYVHPFFALVKRDYYLQLPPFEKHGAPCLKNEFTARKKGFGMIDFPVREYVYHFGRGTVNGQGYGLGVAGQYEKFKKYYRRLKGMFR
jgi:hypothetical protein